MINYVQEMVDYQGYLLNDQRKFNEMEVFTKIIYDSQALRIFARFDWVLFVCAVVAVV